MDIRPLGAPLTPELQKKFIPGPSGTEPEFVSATDSFQPSAQSTGTAIAAGGQQQQEKRVSGAPGRRSAESAAAVPPQEYPAASAGVPVAIAQIEEQLAAESAVEIPVSRHTEIKGARTTPVTGVSALSSPVQGTEPGGLSAVLPQALRAARRIENSLLSIVGLDDPVERLRPTLKAINALEPAMSALSDVQLKAKTAEFKARLAQGESADDLLVEAYAAAREASKRVTGMRHHDVQVLGGIALHQHKIAEMATGEGKTLTEVLPVYLNALAGKGVHVVTVNETLAKRDSQWMGAIFEYMGLSVGCATEGMEPQQKKKAYDCDITYLTNVTLGFDYLRDNLAKTPDQCVQRAPWYALVDEVDEILIDEARTPLIVSRYSEPSAGEYRRFADITGKLKPGEDYTVDYEKRSCCLTEEGLGRVEAMAGVDNLYSEENLPMVHYMQASLNARALFMKDKDYIVQNGRVQIVDEFTGRVMEGRRYSNGLHQALEAREGVKIEPEQTTLASITYPNLFRRYPNLAGMSGTAKTESQEFQELYGLETVQIPTNKPVARRDLPDLLFKTQEEKFAAIASKVEELCREGQPVLVGTRSVVVNEYLHSLLEARGIPHQILNARSVKDNTIAENAIIAKAGRCGMVTLATNMAGRGVDIKPDLVNFKKMAQSAYREAKAKKPVLTVFRNTEERDELVKWLDRNGIAHQDHAPGRNAAPGAVSILVQNGGALPEFGGKVLSSSDFPTGGLYVIGTERHESRRIDNQLKGRSGRQGNEGTTQFYNSLDDEILSLFGGKKLGRVFDRLGIAPGEPVSGGIMDSAIESAQKRIGSMHSDMRRHTTKRDVVLNMHRELVYEDRRAIIEGLDLSEDTKTWIGEWSRETVESTAKRRSATPEEMKRINEYCSERLGFAPFKEEDMKGKVLRPSVIAKVEETLRTRLDEALRDRGQSRELMKNLMLDSIDRAWFDHLENMDELSQGVGLVAYAQQDPEIEYKKKSFELFQAMKSQMKEMYLKSLLNSRPGGNTINYIVIDSDGKGAR